MTERKTYCEDWACPAAVSCARHFGRSSAYAGMKRHPAFNLEKFDRGVGADCCAFYEYDKPKAWLQPQPGQITHTAGQGRLEFGPE